MPDVLRVQSASIETPVKCAMPHGLSSGGYVPQASFMDWARGNALVPGPGGVGVLAVPAAGSNYSIYSMTLTLDPSGIVFPVNVFWYFVVGIPPVVIKDIWFTANHTEDVFDASPFGVRVQPVTNASLRIANQSAQNLSLYWEVLYSLEI